ncbi:hypothetical protein ON010_g15002 [Phytophthora cinnamomi]|nr:hypothetical protein ON010_g15002 [Phytophthora cinnamomi]
MVASGARFTDVASVLLDSGASVDQQLSNGATPLLIASEAGNIDVVYLLLTHDATIDLGNQFGDTPLKRAT